MKAETSVKHSSSCSARPRHGNSSILKSRYDQLGLTSGQKIDRLNNAIESSKTELSAESVKHEKCRTRVKTIEEESVKLQSNSRMRI